MKELIYIALLLPCILAVPISHENTYTPVVETTYGKLRGFRKLYKGGTYDAFRGIPTAKPPVGKLRWERPLPPDRWDGILDATSFGPTCTRAGGSPPRNGEDCLYLNIYVPNGIDTKRDVPLPVMAYAHGGGFISGSSNGYRGQELALDGNVIVLAFNYRLSSLGGLSTSDANIPGNYHLWDARAALLWIQDNIKQFGGDRTRVTLFGQSAGAILTSHMALSPLTDGLIHRTISMSGNAASPVGLQFRSANNAKNLASMVECPEEPVKDLVSCLRQKEAHELDLNGYLSMVLLSGTIPGWTPTVDGAIVGGHPNDMWKNGGAKNIDFMVGRTEHDAAGFVYINLNGSPRNHTLSLASDKVVMDLVARFILQTYARRPEDIDDLVKIVKARYPDFESDVEVVRAKAMTQMVTDWAFASPAHNAANLHARNAAATGKNTYLYNFKYRASFLHYAPWVQGSHSDMLHFTFGEPFNQGFRASTLGNFSTTDLKVKENVVKYYGNFAHTGDPNKGPHKVVTEWPKYNPNTQQYLEMSDNMEAKKEEKQLLNRLNFWLKEWPKITVPEGFERSRAKTHENLKAAEIIGEIIKNYMDSMP